jgi:hypothetical protein
MSGLVRSTVMKNGLSCMPIYREKEFVYVNADRIKSLLCSSLARYPLVDKVPLVFVGLPHFTDIISFNKSRSVKSAQYLNKTNERIFSSQIPVTVINN